MKNSDARRLSKRLGITYTHALRVVKQIWALCRAEGISYRKAERRVLAGLIDPAWPTDDTEAVLRAAVRDWCERAPGQDVDDGRAGRDPAAGLPFGDVAWPATPIESITIWSVSPDLETLEWTVDEVYDGGGTEAVNVSVDAEIAFDGYLHRGDIDALEDDDSVTVKDNDPGNDHYVEVNLTRSATLTFHAIIEPGQQYPDSLEFGGASQAGHPDLDPHSR